MTITKGDKYMAFLWMFLMFLATVFLFGQAVNSIRWMIKYNKAIDNGVRINDQKVLAKLLVSTFSLLALYATCWLFTGLYAGEAIWGDFVGAAIGIIISAKTFWKSTDAPYVLYVDDSMTGSNIHKNIQYSNERATYNNKKILPNSSLYSIIVSKLSNDAYIPVEVTSTTINGFPADVYEFEPNYGKYSYSNPPKTIIGAIQISVIIRKPNDYLYFNVEWKSEKAHALFQIFYGINGALSNKKLIDNLVGDLTIHDTINIIEKHMIDVSANLPI